MTPETKASQFESWAILELLGHRRLAGFVRETMIAGAGLLRIDVPSQCEGGDQVTWCPEHGECTCPQGPVGVAGCPLHGASSQHGDTWVITQFYPPSSVYCLTPTTEGEARRVARQVRPAPYARYEQPRLPSHVEGGDLSADADEGEQDGAGDDEEFEREWP